MSHVPLLTVLTFLPLAGGIAVMSLGNGRNALARRLALGFTLGTLAATIDRFGNWTSSPPGSAPRETYSRSSGAAETARGSGSGKPMSNDAVTEH